jgi:hypothetical protein
MGINRECLLTLLYFIELKPLAQLDVLVMEFSFIKQEILLVIRLMLKIIKLLRKGSQV